MIGEVWRYVMARRRLRRHQAEHGNLLDGGYELVLNTETGGWRRQRLTPDHPVHRALTDSPRDPACGLPVAGTGYLCTEWTGHDGPHRSLLAVDPLPRCRSTVNSTVRCSLQPGHGGLHRGTVYDTQTGRHPVSAAAWADYPFHDGSPEAREQAMRDHGGGA